MVQLSFLLCVCVFMATPVAYEVPRLGVESELQLPAYITATEMLDQSRICDLHCSSHQYQIQAVSATYNSQQCWILNPVSEASD